MDKQIAEYRHHAILTSNKKEETTDAHDSMNKLQNNYAEWKKLDQNRVPIIWFQLYEILENAK